jgi:hypothetical protein
MSASFEALFAKAQAAGLAAGQARKPTAIVVGEAASPFSPPGVFKPGAQLFHEPEGCCGFAWVEIAGNTSFGRWAKKAGKAKPGYPSGLMFWISEHGQSVERKEAHANAFARVLNEAGIKAHPMSRLD